MTYRLQTVERNCDLEEPHAQSRGAAFCQGSSRTREVAGETTFVGRMSGFGPKRTRHACSWMSALEGRADMQ